MAFADDFDFYFVTGIAGADFFQELVVAGDGFVVDGLDNVIGAQAGFFGGPFGDDRGDLGAFFGIFTGEAEIDIAGRSFRAAVESNDDFELIEAAKDFEAEFVADFVLAEYFLELFAGGDALVVDGLDQIIDEQAGLGGWAVFANAGDAGPAFGIFGGDVHEDRCAGARR